MHRLARAVFWAACALGGAACYSPSIAPCVYACSANQCPSGLTCNQNIQMCVANAGDTCSGMNDGGPNADALVDSMVSFDATTCGWPSLSNIDPCPGPNGLDVDTRGQFNWTIAMDTNVDLDMTSGLPVGPTLVDVPLTSGVNAHAIIVQSLTVNLGRTLTIKSRAPVIIVAAAAVLVRGTIDITPTNKMCGGSAGQAAPVNGGASGGGGGGFGSLGGKGGDGLSNFIAGNDMKVTTGGLGGAALPPDTLVPLRGGCAGGDGGPAGSFTSPGGSGGGAIQISSKIRVTLDGMINAGGGGGAAGMEGMQRGGGGGGGSGGGILIEAPMVTISNSGQLCANGGGGGGGGDASTATNGNPGKGCTVAQGGQGVLNNQNYLSGGGGDGGAAPQPFGSDGGPADAHLMKGIAGGGGGGSVGRIRINGTLGPGTNLESSTSPLATKGSLPAP